MIVFTGDHAGLRMDAWMKYTRQTGRRNPLLLLCTSQEIYSKWV